MSVQSSLRSNNDLRIGRKMVNFQLFSLSREQVVVRRSQIWTIGWVNKSMCCKCPVTRGIIVQERDPWWTSRGGFLQNVLQLPHQRWIILRVDSLVLWSVINEEDAVFIHPHPQKKKRQIKEGIFQRIFALGFFWGGKNRYDATPLTVALSAVHSDITRFRPWSPIATRKHFDRAEKNSKICSDDCQHWRFWSAFRYFGNHLAESYLMSKS